MSETITLYRVFISTPGGLEQERRAFVKTLEKYKSAEAIPRQATFLPVVWEDTLGGVGRPQSLINQDLNRSDYFVMVLWDRWGTPPGDDHQNYTSGTEEEYRLAVEHARDPKHPLCEVVVLFKKIEDSQRLQDPGPQLKKVLRFKKQLEADRTLLFSTFADASEFEDLIRRHLAQWLREHDLNSTSQAAREARIPQAYTAPGLVVRTEASPTTTRSASLTINLFAGNREPLRTETNVLFRVIDGQQKQLYADFKKASSVTFAGLPFYDNFGDNYTVIVAADGYKQVGFTPCKITPHHLISVDLMLVREGAVFNFQDARWDLLHENRPHFARLLAAGTKDNATAKESYSHLMESRSALLACFFNLATALSQIHFPDCTALDCIRELIWDENRTTQDRFFAWADVGIIDRLTKASAQALFAPGLAPAMFHQGATRSWKQVQFGEANIQLTFHENDKRILAGTTCVAVELSFDYYRDLAAHTLLEIFAEKSSVSLAAPGQVYVLLWRAGRHAGMPDFDPPYFLD